MAIRKVAVMGNPVLRRKADPVPESAISSKEIQLVIEDMIETMFEYDGRGLAAPQVHENLRIVVMFLELEKKPEDAPILCLINPIVTPLTTEMSSYWEGCLSLPGLRGKVSRLNRISLSALSPKAEKIQMDVGGFDATVVQHECDHLDGVLYVDRIKDLRDLAFNAEYRRFLSKDDSKEESE